MLVLLYYVAKNNIFMYDISGNVTFSRIFTQRHIFKNVVEHKIRVWFSAQSLSETFIVRRTERGTTINEHMYSCKTFVIIVRFVLKLDILNRFLKSNKILIFKISVQ